MAGSEAGWPVFQKRRRLRQGRQLGRPNGDPGFSADPFATDFSSAFSWSSPDVRQRGLLPPGRGVSMLDA